MPPGRKNKGECPSDIHLRLPDDIRALIDELGPGKYQDKIIDSIRRCSRKRPPKSPIEIQMEILELRKELRIRHERLDILKEELEFSCGLSEEEYERIQKRLNEDVETWWESVK